MPGMNEGEAGVIHGVGRAQRAFNQRSAARREPSIQYSAL